MNQSVHVVNHPLVAHKLTLLRDRSTPTPLFRDLLAEVGALLVFEATRDLPTVSRTIETPMQRHEGTVVRGSLCTLVSVLRAGNGLLDGARHIFPTARVGHVGLFRDHETLEAVEYYRRLPAGIAEHRVLVLDPMLATGASAVAALDCLRREGARSMVLVTLIAAPKGVASVREAHPDVPIYTASLDEGLDDRGYILPGLGDAGDRLYGTGGDEGS